MSQARRQRKLNTTTQKLIGHGLREIVLIFFCFMGLYLFVSLFTYYPLDPGWSHTGQVEEVRNKGGVAGALFADIFFYLFGFFAYLFPIMVGYMGWMIYKGRHHDIFAEPKNLVVPGIGFVLTLSAGCGLAIVHFAAESVLLPSHAGGILGMVVGKSLQGVFSQLGATLLLLALFFTGVTLLTGLSWLKLMDTLGLHTLRFMPIVEKYFAQQFLPWLLKYLERGWLFISAVSVAGYVKTRDWVLEKWDNFQARRHDDWQYEDDELFEEDDYDNNTTPKRGAGTRAHINPPEPIVADDLEPPVRDQARRRPSKKPLMEDDASEVAESVVVEDAVIVEPEAPAIAKLPLLADAQLLNQVEPLKNVSKTALANWLTKGFTQLALVVEMKAVHPGPVLVGFEVQPETPLKLEELEALSLSLAKALNVSRVKMVETTPGIIGIETPNPKRQSIHLSHLLSSDAWQNSSASLTLALGQDVVGQSVIVELNRVPHLIIAGSDSEERDLLLNSLLLSVLFKNTPAALRLVLIDGRKGCLANYAELPHLLTPLLSQMEQVEPVLQWCVQEMERRYRLMAKKGARTIDSYNQALQVPPDPMEIIDPEASDEPLPYILIVVQEIAELTLNSEANATIEEHITRLTQKARAAGLHLMMATQYPSVNVVTGLLKANIPSRIALRVNNKSESRTVLGQLGAEHLMGDCDLLYLTPGTGLPARVHGAQVSLAEVEKVLADLRERGGPPQYLSLDKA